MADIEKVDHTRATSGTTANGGSRIANTTPLPGRRIANPAPLGLCSFASTTLLLSLVNVFARGLHEPNVVLGMALFVGGLAQLLAGMWEFAAGNALGATAFTSYGAFWGSYASFLIPAFNILPTYTTAAEQGSALGLYLATWFIFTFICFLATLRTNMGLIALFFFLDITFLLLMIAELLGNTSVQKAGGAFGIITAFIAYYVGCSELLISHNGAFNLPLLHIKKSEDI